MMQIQVQLTASNQKIIIEKCEFKDLLKELGFTDMSKKDMSALFKDIDLNNDNVISFYEFLLIMKKIKSQIIIII